MNTALRVLIVDDELLSRERIRALLARCADVEMIGECADGIQAVDRIDTAAPDLVFLDVQMPELNGLAVVEAVSPDRCPQVVFVTAYNTYMERAFELHALDYLRKPFTDARFYDALEHARRRVVERRGYDDAHRGVLAILAGLRGRDDPRTDRLVIRDAESGVYRVLETGAVDWIEAHEKHVRVHVGGKAFHWRKTLTEAERILDPRVFLRLHRSFIVNTHRVRTAEPLWKGEYVLKLESGKSLGTGRAYRAATETFLRSS